jgi:hypothetical protein
MGSREVKFHVPLVFRPLLQPARYKGRLCRTWQVGPRAPREVAEPWRETMADPGGGPRLSLNWNNRYPPPQKIFNTTPEIFLIQQIWVRWRPLHPLDVRFTPETGHSTAYSISFESTSGELEFGRLQHR